ncbi:MAG: hypothetical protein KDA84_07915 [Planctomycetaceae bacterium]|nr:hypothetical protein [Planctomycetaceae bacterium]
MKPFLLFAMCLCVCLLPVDRQTAGQNQPKPIGLIKQVAKLQAEVDELKALIQVETRKVKQGTQERDFKVIQLNADLVELEELHIVEDDAEGLRPEFGPAITGHNPVRDVLARLGPHHRKGISLQFIDPQTGSRRAQIGVNDEHAAVPVVDRRVFYFRIYNDRDQLVDTVRAYKANGHRP